MKFARLVSGKFGKALGSFKATCNAFSPFLYRRMAFEAYRAGASCGWSVAFAASSSALDGNIPAECVFCGQSQLIQLECPPGSGNVP